MSYDCFEEEVVFYGFHQGALYGLDAPDRLEKQRKNSWFSPRARILRTPPIKGVLFDRISKANTKASPGCTLEEALEGCTADNLRKALRRVGIPTKSGLRKAQLVSLLTEELPKAMEGFRSSAEHLEVEGIKLLKRTLQGETVTHEPQDHAYSIPDLFPLAFVSESEGTCVSFSPTELQKSFGEVDLTPHLAEKCLLESANRVLHAATTLCGIVPVDTLFDLLQSSEEQPLPRAQFDLTLKQLTTKPSNPSFFLIEADGITYAAHRQLENPSSTRRVFSWEDEDGRYASWREQYWRTPHNTVSPSVRLEGFLRQQRTTALTRIENGFTALDDIGKFIYGLPSVRRLTAYFDGHVPYGESEYAFADEMIDLLIRLILFESQGIKTIRSWLTETGWCHSEGCYSSPTLSKLICDLFKELPRWEYGGWSEVEYLDLMDMPSLISETQLYEDSLELAS